MDRRRIAPWLVPSIGEILFFCILMRTLYLGGQLLNDGDTGWHLVAADVINDRGEILAVARNGAQHQPCLLSSLNSPGVLLEEPTLASFPAPV